MCGIAGIYNYKTNHSVDERTLAAMSEKVLHRGPDDEGFYVDGNIGLAFRRLSIIDLQTGNQPIHNEDKSVWVVFNGEIYNYIELKEDLEARGHRFYTKTDTEVIVHLYEEYGYEFALQLNGMFGIAIWDDNKKTLMLVRDRPGIKPLYYAETEGGVAFASEIKSLLMSGISREPDFEALNQYLSYGFVLAPLTGFRLIRKVKAGSMLICSGNGLREQEFWDLVDEREAVFFNDEMEAIDHLIDELSSVLNRQTRSDVPLGIFLSGGIDSSLIASVAVEKCNFALDAFTVGFREKTYNELENARKVAKRLGIKLHEFILSEKEIFGEIEQIMNLIDEPLFDYSAIPVYFISKLARSHVKTVVGGEGGDELFGGYQTHYLPRVTGWYRKIPEPLRNIIRTSVSNMPESHSYLSTAYKLRRFTYGAEYPYDEAHYRWKILFDETDKRSLVNDDFINCVASLESFNPMKRYFDRARKRGLDITDQLMYVDFKTFLQDDPLQKTDRMSMANSLEIRVPLLDNDLISFSRRIPNHFKINGFKTKYILRKALSRFQPHEIAFGKKRGFTPPLALWIKNDLNEYMNDILSPDNISRIGFLNYNYITSIINDHMNGKAENSRPIWALVVLVNWYRNYVDK
jgi:asparagine synthase (glutamine-hydrolysing)